MDSKPFIRSSNIWGRMVLTFLGPKIVLFYEIIGGAFNAPPRQETYIFDPATNRVKSSLSYGNQNQHNILWRSEYIRPVIHRMAHVDLLDNDNDRARRPGTSWQYGLRPLITKIFLFGSLETVTFMGQTLNPHFVKAATKTVKSLSVQCKYFLFKIFLC